MSAIIASQSPPQHLPPEIWLKIFRIATFIPLETDFSTTTFEPGLFCTYDEYQAQQFEKVLPIRRTIVQVSRRFYQIGAEVLYTTFHANAGRINDSDQRCLLFSRLLVSRPELGQFIRRLSLNAAADEEKNYRIITHCPNVVIFSSFLSGSLVDLVPWWSRGLPKTIRSLDANLLKNVPLKDTLTFLETLPHLEVLHLWGVPRNSTQNAPICFPALRMLSIYFSDGFNDATGFHLPILSTMQLPRLTALTTNVSVIDAHLPFPLDVWRRLEYFKPVYLSYLGLRPDYFPNLRRLHLLVYGGSFERSLRCFPFHQLESLTFRVNAPSFIDTWKGTTERVVAFPLDIEAMPRLKLFQLEWEPIGTYKHDISLNKDQFIQYIGTLVTRFGQRGVLFIQGDVPRRR